MQTNNKQKKTKQMRNVNNILYGGNCMGKAAKKAESKCLQGKATRGKPIYTPGPRKAQEFIILGSPEGREAQSRSPWGGLCPRGLPHLGSQAGALTLPGRRWGSFGEDQGARCWSLGLRHTWGQEELHPRKEEWKETPHRLLEAENQGVSRGEGDPGRGKEGEGD